MSGDRARETHLLPCGFKRSAHSHPRRGCGLATQGAPYFNWAFLQFPRGRLEEPIRTLPLPSRRFPQVMTHSPPNDSPVRRGDSKRTDAREAVAELDATLGLQTAALGVLFYSPSYDEEALVEELTKRQAAGPIVACTTAGEIGMDGYQDDSISGFSLTGDEFQVAIGVVDGLSDFSIEQAGEIATTLRADLGAQVESMKSSNCFVLLLVDGLSGAEEPLTFKLQQALGDIPLVGGSAGDRYDFKSTRIIANGKAASDRAVIVMVHTTRPFQIISEQAFHPTDRKVVITGADPGSRKISEINGITAAEGYAELLNLEGPDQLTAELFAERPLMLQLGGQWHVRSPQTVLEGGAIQTYCAVEEGNVLSVGECIDFAGSLRETLEAARSKIGEIQLLIACDCIQRRMRIESHDELELASEIMREFNAIGFSTYGEQCGTVHMNQTLTAIAIA